MNIPFYNYVVYQIFIGNKIQHICTDLKRKNLEISEGEVSAIYRELIETTPKSISDAVVNREPLDLTNENHIDYLKHYNIYEYYLNYLHKNGQIEVEYSKEFFDKWIEDIEWLMSYKDVMTIVNILMFNGESLEGVSAVVQFKFKKKIGYDALLTYKNVFWNIEAISAKEAMKYCPMLKDSSYVIRRFENGEVEVEHAEFTKPEQTNGSMEATYIMDTDYIKWKIGYKDIKVPDVKDFLKQVQMDAMMKYRESLTMEKVVEIDREEGDGYDGPINITRTKRRNVEAERLRMAKGWVDMFIKASEKMPDDEASEDSFFDNLSSIKMEFVNTEKIMSVDDDPNLLDDIKDDVRN